MLFLTLIQEFLLNRKSISDDEGEDLVKSLQYNHTLRVLNLESNHLGPSFLYALSDTLKVNTSLTNIDISGNSLTNGNNISGIEALCESLKENDTLTHLSLYNTSLPEKAGQLLLETLDYNDSLILLDLEKNPQIKLDTIRAIQIKIRENYNKWRSLRFDEWTQRNILKSQEKEIKDIRAIRESEENEVKRILDDAKRQQNMREELWIKEMADRDEERSRRERKIEKEALARAKKKKRRGRKKKK